MKNLRALSAAFLILCSANLFAADPVPPKNFGVEEFEKLSKDKSNVILDVRTKKEYDAGHLPGAVNIDWNSPEFAEKVKALDKNKTYLVHCAVGGRSAKACDKMSHIDFAHTYNLEGGMKAWEKAGKSVEK